MLPELVCHWLTRDHPPHTSSTQPATTSAHNSLTSSDTLVSQPHKDDDSSSAEQAPSSLEVTASVALIEDSELTIASSSMTNNNFTFSSEIDEDTWCYCKSSEDYDFMTACEAKDCKIEWYHLLCVNLTMDDVPKDEEPWYCHTCTNKMD